MILAGIDIGTNSLRLLVAETGPDSFKHLYSERRTTRLGRDLDRTGKLSNAAGERSLNVLCDFAETIRRCSAFATAAVGTSAIRNASNSAAFIEAVKKKSGIDINVINGEEEARLTLIGVTKALSAPGGLSKSLLASAIVIDIGGGSTELIMTRPRNEPRMVSLPMGVVYLSDRFINNDPPTDTEGTLLRRAISDSLEQYAGMMGPRPDSVLIGTAGTVTTLASMDLELAEYDPDKINGYSLTKKTVDELVHRLGISTLAERRKLPGLEPGREDIIFAGAVIVQEIMERFGFTTMLVSDWGLREGIVMDLFERLKATNNR